MILISTLFDCILLCILSFLLFFSSSFWKLRPARQLSSVLSSHGHFLPLPRRRSTVSKSHLSSPDSKYTYVPPSCSIELHTYQIPAVKICIPLSRKHS